MIDPPAISLAGHLKLGRLIAFWDNNSISIDGATSLAVSDNEVERLPAPPVAGRREYPGERQARPAAVDTDTPATRDRLERN